MHIEAFETAFGKESIENTIRLDKAMDFIKENAVFVEGTADTADTAETNTGE